MRYRIIHKTFYTGKERYYAQYRRKGLLGIFGWYNTRDNYNSLTYRDEVFRTLEDAKEGIKEHKGMARKPIIKIIEDV